LEETRVRTKRFYEQLIRVYYNNYYNQVYYIGVYNIHSPSRMQRSKTAVRWTPCSTYMATYITRIWIFSPIVGIIYYVIFNLNITSSAADVIYMYTNLTYSSFDSFIVQSNYTRILIHITRILNTYRYIYILIKARFQWKNWERCFIYLSLIYMQAAEIQRNNRCIISWQY
jgi:hypothetical protein